jgi:beta-1,4-mannooligosaccharide/beta-1,4-mannosyl-N-acetylglucosamine phosphorylase
LTGLPCPRHDYARQSQSRPFPREDRRLLLEARAPFPRIRSRKQEHFDKWISRSPDLLHWGGARLLISVEDVPWANAKIGPGSPPLISSDPVLEPIAHYETGEGFRTNVVFPSAAILESDGLIKLYYGASDTSVCLAEADSRDILDYLAYCRVTLPGGL